MYCDGDSPPRSPLWDLAIAVVGALAASLAPVAAEALARKLWPEEGKEVDEPSTED